MRFLVILKWRRMWTTLCQEQYVMTVESPLPRSMSSLSVRILGPWYRPHCVLGALTITCNFVSRYKGLHFLACECSQVEVLWVFHIVVFPATVRNIQPLSPNKPAACLILQNYVIDLNPVACLIMPCLIMPCLIMPVLNYATNSIQKKWPCGAWNSVSYIYSAFLFACLVELNII